MSEEKSNNLSLVSLGKPIDKLIDTVSKAVGTLYRPRAIRNEADAEAYKIEVVANAKAKASIIKSETENEIAERARQRLYHKEMQRQDNLDNIVENSTKHLDENVSDEPVDEDWRTKFFNKAQDITSDELQQLWGKILANEINKPGTISVRSLEILSNLSKTEAEILKKISSLTSARGRIYKINGNNLEQFGIKYSDLLILRSAGLMYDSDNLIIHFSSDPIAGQLKPNGVFLNICGSTRLVYKNDGSQVDNFENFLLTPAGVEIITVIGYEPDMEYYKALVLEYGKRGIVITDIFKFIEDNLPKQPEE